MQNNTKTPIMILQEFTVSHGFPVPEYNIVRVNLGAHQDQFHSTVDVNISKGERVIGCGTGSTKKAAKHDSAYDALKQLKSRGVVTQMSETVSPTKANVNCIGKLVDMCTENKLPNPEFTLKSDVGLPHCRQFTYQCKLSNMITQATEGSKKQAKQVAAEKMFDKIKDILPKLVEEYTNKHIDQDEEKSMITKKYLEWKADIRFNYSIPVVEMDRGLINLIKSKDLQVEPLNQYFTEASKENVCAILKYLELEHNVIKLEEEAPFVVSIQINAEFPITVLTTGDTIEEAEARAYIDIHDKLQYFIKYNFSEDTTY